jgi:hypothetical protein
LKLKTVVSRRPGSDQALRESFSSRLFLPETEAGAPAPCQHRCNIDLLQVFSSETAGAASTPVRPPVAAPILLDHRYAEQALDSAPDFRTASLQEAADWIILYPTG